VSQQQNTRQAKGLDWTKVQFLNEGFA